MMKKNIASLDVLNLAQTWINAVLYFHKVYPESAFIKRTAYGVEVPVAAAPPLKKYIANFMSEIEGQI